MLPHVMLTELEGQFHVRFGCQLLKQLVSRLNLFWLLSMVNSLSVVANARTLRLIWMTWDLTACPRTMLAQSLGWHLMLMKMQK